MENTLILYDNKFIEIKEILETMMGGIENSKLYNINEQINNINDCSNIVLTIYKKYEDNFNLYEFLGKNSIDFDNKKLIIVYIGSSQENIIKFIEEIKIITKKSDLYYSFINLDNNNYENKSNPINNINKYIKTNKRSKRKIMF